MQQIKIKCFRKKKNLTIESIKIELFEKSNYSASRRQNTVDQPEKVTIFSPSKRYLQSISPKKIEHKQQRILYDSSQQENIKFGIRRYAQKDSVGLTCIKKRVIFAKQVNQLKLAMRRSTISKTEESQKIVKRLQERQMRALTPIPNELYIPKSLSQNVKRMKAKSDIFVSDASCFSISKDSYENSMLLKPLNVSISLPDSDCRKKNQERIRQLEHALLSENRDLIKASRMDGRCRETLVSPWRTRSNEMELNFGQF